MNCYATAFETWLWPKMAAVEWAWYLSPSPCCFSLIDFPIYSVIPFDVAPRTWLRRKINTQKLHTSPAAISPGNLLSLMQKRERGKSGWFFFCFISELLAGEVGDFLHVRWFVNHAKKIFVYFFVIAFG